MSELTKEQLLEYVKKQKIKIKQLEEKLNAATAAVPPGVAAVTDKVEVTQGDNPTVPTDVSSTIENLKAELKAKDEKISKYNALVKQKMREIDSLKAQLAESKRTQENSTTSSSSSSSSSSSATFASDLIDADTLKSLNSWSSSLVSDFSTIFGSGETQPPQAAASDAESVKNASSANSSTVNGGDMQEELEKTKKSLVNSSKKLLKLEKDLKVEQEVSNEYKTKFQNLQLEMEELKKQLESHQSDLLNGEKKVIENDELSELRNKITDYCNENARLKEQLDAARIDADQLKEKHTELESLKWEFEDLQAKNDELSSQIKNMMDTKKELEQVRQELNLARSNGSEGQEKIDAMRQSLEEKMTEIEALKEKLSVAAVAESDWSKKIEDLTVANKEALQSRAEQENRLTNDLAVANESIATLTAQVEKIRDENNAIINDKLKQISELEAKILDLTKSVADSEASHKELLSEKTALAHELENANAKLSKTELELNSLIESLKSEVAALKTAAEERESKIAELNATSSQTSTPVVDAATAPTASTTSTVSVNEQQPNTNTNTNQGKGKKGKGGNKGGKSNTASLPPSPPVLTPTSSEPTTSPAAPPATIAPTETPEYKSLEEKNKNLETEISRLVGECDRLGEKVQTLEKTLHENNELLAKAAEAERKLKESLASSTDTLKEANGAIQSQLDAASQQLTNCLGQVKEKEVVISDLETKIAEKEGKIQKMESDMQANLEMQSSLEMQAKDNETLVVNLRKEIEELQSVIANNNQQLALMNNAGTQNQQEHEDALNRKTEEIETLAKEVERLQCEITAKVESATKESEALRFDLLVSEKALDQARTELATAQMIGVEANNTINALQQSIEEKGREMDSLKEQFSTTEADLRTSLEALTNTNKAQETTILNLEQKLSDSEKILAESNGELEKLRKQQADSVEGNNNTEMKTTTKELEDKVKKATAVILKLKKQVASLEEAASKSSEEHNAAVELLKVNHSKELKNAHDDAASAREEREIQRRRVLDLEGLIESVGILGEEKIAELTSEFEQISSNGLPKTLDGEGDSSTTSNDSSKLTLIINRLAAITTAAINERALATATVTNVENDNAELITELKLTNSALELQLKTEAADAESKIAALTEKVHRMKVLLAKAKKSAQEREAEFSEKETEFVELSEMFLARPKRFSIQARVSLPPYEGAPVSKNIVWCLLFEDQAPGSKLNGNSVSSHKNSFGLRWVEESKVQAWIAEGSTVFGKHPDELQEIWANELVKVRQELEAEKSSIQAELDVVNQNFSAYKLRAQTALKRLGHEERTERQKTVQIESDQVKQLTEEINALEANVKSLELKLQSEQEALKKLETLSNSQVAKISELEAKLEERSHLLKETESKVTKMQRQITQQSPSSPAAAAATTSSTAISSHSSSILPSSSSKLAPQCEDEASSRSNEVESRMPTMTSQDNMIAHQGKKESSLSLQHEGSSLSQHHGVVVDDTTISTKNDSIHLQDIESSTNLSSSASTHDVDNSTTTTNNNNSNPRNDKDNYKDNDKDEDEAFLGKSSILKSEQRKKRIQAAERMHTQTLGVNGKDDFKSADELSLLLTGESISSVVKDADISATGAMLEGNAATGIVGGAGVDRTARSGKNFVLQEQAENDLKEAITVLRNENANLVVEILDVKRSMALHDEQVTCLKETIRELESSLCREREFNAANTRMNTEYLVNVLRKFLTSNSPEERSKLVSVLCTILHFQSDETRQIVDKWAVKVANGPLSWFRGNRPITDGAAPPAPIKSDIRRPSTQSFDPVDRL